MTFLWGVTDYLTRQLQVIVMHTAHLANVSKSVTKNATFPRTGGLPCLITWQLHLLQLLGDSFFESQQPPSWDPCSHYSMGLTLVFLSINTDCILTFSSVFLRPHVT